ncbi:hypothetical protein BKP35_17295 [Anaerobacillus arseniciselenatis]|uniref:Lipoprotein n=1 Tax=Anaerobacillus arseniciselenatis TaxID=85682 RepID=A0A1S2LA06_9BACI|nr:hypothetical protein [Anaerobacillus arseniciselenatis]OIJ09154.1 hypothetical protein BKP35_17295 [Anaerobacillus arseniciselenatis]
MKRGLIFFIVSYLLFILTACELLNNGGYYPSLEEALNAEINEGTNEVLLDDEEQRMVVYLFKRDENDSGMLTVVTYDKKGGKYKRDIGRGEVAMSLGGDFGEFAPILFQQFIHPETDDKYLNGVVSSKSVKEVNIKFFVPKENGDDNEITRTAQIESNNVFLINIGNLYTDAEKMEVELIGDNGEVVEVVRYGFTN